MHERKISGGLFNERPERPGLLWKVPLWHDLSLAFVCGAALGVWIYIIVDSLAILLGRRVYAGSILLTIALVFVLMRLYCRLGGKINQSQLSHY